MKLVVVFAAAVVIAAVATGILLAQSNPFVGTWKLNLAKSKDPGAFPKEETLSVQVVGGQRQVTIKGTSMNGLPISFQYEVPDKGGLGKVLAGGPYDAGTPYVVPPEAGCDPSAQIPGCNDFIFDVQTHCFDAGGWRTSNLGAEFRNPGRRSVGLRLGVIVVRPPERREVPAEVQFEVARNAVTDVTNLRTARLRTWQGQQWEEQVDARLELGSCRRPEPIDLGLRRG